MFEVFSRLKLPVKIVLAVIVFAVFFFGGRFAYQNGWIPGVKPTASSVPKAANVPQGIEVARASVPELPLPSTKPTRKINKPPVRMLVWAWNSQMGQMLANGGPITTQDSIMERHGVKAQFTRQDDAEKMKADLVAFATELADGNPNPSSGTHFVQIMGDGYAQFAASINPVLKKLGDEYTVRWVGSAGRSVGEDGFWGPEDWKSNPQSAKGGVCVGYLRDGDWNIAMKWLADNGIKNNPDEGTYDPEAMNWIAASDYIDAVQKIIQGYRETRPVVINGKKTGEKKEITGDSVVTWTPGDVMLAQQFGGMVRILSTRENDGQMPNAIIGINKWCKDNRETVVELLAAIFEGSDQVKLYSKALDHAGIISAKVYGEKDGPYWVKYYQGAIGKDKQGLTVELGGSGVFGLADNLNLFGLRGGHANVAEATYTVFGDIVVNQYPKLVPSYPPFKEVADTSYLQEVARKYPVVEATQDAAATYESSENIVRTTGNRNWDITFRSGSAELTPEGMRTCEQLARELSINNFKVEIHGHTDNTGNAQENKALSLRRAQTVKSYLERKYSATFPANRIASPTGHGQDDPVADNGSEVGRSKNRRVQIIQGTT